MATLSRNKLVQYLAFSTLGLLVSVSEASIPRRSLHQSREIVYARNTTTSTITTTTTATIDVAAPTISPVNVSNNTNSTSSPNVDSSNPTSGSRSVVYFPNWDIYGRNYQPSDLPVETLTHVLYSFANIRAETGEVYLSDEYADLQKHYPEDSWNDVGNNVYGCVKQLYLLKKANRHLKVLLSIGGWTYSANFPAAAATEAGRTMFASSAVGLLKDLGFDGLDIDWEYPKDETEATNFVLLLSELHSTLANYSSTLPTTPHFLLTAAVPAGPDNYSQLKIPAMSTYLDFWNLMAYDYAGSWDTHAGHQANLYPSTTNSNSTPFSTDVAVQWYLDHGVAPEKLVLGMPLYGRSFTNTRGPGEVFSGVGEGSWEAGVWDYKVLPPPGAEVFFDEEAVASWSFDEGSRTMVSYDSPEVTGRKLRYIEELGLGGAMWWEVNGDQVETGGSLVKMAVKGMEGMDRSGNVLEFPESRFENLRGGMV